MKGLNYEQVGFEINRKWSRFTNPRSIDGDVSRLDSSISNEGQRLYHSFVSKFYDGEDLEEFQRLAEWQLDVGITGRAQNGTVSFKSSGLGSGQMNTSQTGVFIVCFIILTFIWEYKIDVEVVNCGDDFTIIGEEHTVLFIQTHLKPWFSKFNMVLKTDPVRDTIEQIVFCQTQPVLINGRYRMVRNPYTAMNKDSTSIDNLRSTVSQASYLRAISCTGIATHGGIPILQNVYRMFGRSSNRMTCSLDKRRRRIVIKHCLKENSMKYWGKDLSLKFTHISAETRYSFFLAFGIDSAEQAHYESYYDELYITQYTQPEIIGDVFSE